jgi:Caspase domain/Tetratricopeptide repeat
LRFPDPDDSRAVLIGTAHYTHENFWEIKQIPGNLSALRDLITCPGRGGFTPNHCHLISNPSNVKLLDDHLVDVCREAKDVLLVYFSGHGVVSLEDRQLYLCLANTDPGRLYYTALAIGRVRAAFQKSDAKIKVLILDCCYAGRAISAMVMSDGSTMISKQLEVKGVCTLASAPAYEVSIAEPDAEYTAFTGHLLRLLHEGVPGEASTLTLAAMYPHLKNALVSSGYPEPQQSIQATAGELVLVRNGPDVAPDPKSQIAVTIPPVDYTTAAHATDPEDSSSGSPAGQVLPHRVSADPQSPPAGSAAAQSADHEMRLNELIQLRTQADHAQECDADADAMITELRKIVTDMIALTHPEHSEVLAARDLLAYWLGRGGNPKGAARMYERVAAAREGSLGPDHEAVMATRHNQAHWTGVAGDPDNAVDLLDRVVEDRKRVLGEDHPDTLLSVEGLAFWKGQAGDPAAAAELYRSLAETREWLHGDMDDAVLETRYNLADWVGKAGRPSEAADIYDDLAQRWEAKLGQGCPNGIACRGKGVYWAQRGDNDNN